MVWFLVGTLVIVAIGFRFALLTTLVAGLAIMILYGNPDAHVDIVLASLVGMAIIGDVAIHRSRQRKRAAALIELEAQRQAAIGERVAEIMRGKIVAVDAGLRRPTPTGIFFLHSLEVLVDALFVREEGNDMV